VERSLDSYKFNLLHCKQTFINQLKRGQLGIRTIDEGATDENGMNFSEYMAILSGNTDLLERAKLEKKIAGLESEKKNYQRDQREQEEKMQNLGKENEYHEQNIKDAQADLAIFNKARRLDVAGNVVNDLTIDNFTPPTTVPDDSPSGQRKATPEDIAKALGEQLLRYCDSARTQDAYFAIGSIYGFRVQVKTATNRYQDGHEEYENRIFVESTSHRIHYQHNNGKLNKTSARISSENPLQALLRIPSLISQWENKIEDNKASIEQIAALVGKPWGKEEELKKLKADLAILDRKIETELNATKEAAAASAAAA